MVGPPPPSWAVVPGQASATAVADGVWRLRLPLPWQHIPHVNAYALARDDGGVTLVDAGSAGDPSNWAALAGALGQAGFGVADVRAIVLTHYHSDHAGLVARFVDELGCEVLGHAAHAHFTDAMVRPGEIAAARERRALREGVPRERLYPYRTAREEIEGVMAPVFPDRELREGDTVGAWQVLETPGHAPSHICLWQPESRVLIAGDLVAPAFSPYCDYGYSNDPVAELLGSLERVAGLGDVAVTLPGHGRPLADLPEIVRTWRAGLTSAVADAERAVGEKPDGAYGVMERVFGPDDGTEAGPWLLTQTMCYLRHLRLAGRVERHEVRGRYVYGPAA